MFCATATATAARRRTTTTPTHPQQQFLLGAFVCALRHCRTKKACILFIDEVDAIGGSRGGDEGNSDSEAGASPLHLWLGGMFASIMLYRFVLELNHMVCSNMFNLKGKKPAKIGMMP